MTAMQRLLLGIAGVLAVIAVGTAGFVVVAGMTPFDALYMTVTTVSTVGFREVQPLGRGGQAFTMLLIVFGVGTTLYLLTAIAQTIVEGHLRHDWRRSLMQRRIDELEGHVVVCGYGRFGRVVADELRRQGVATVIVDADAALEPQLRDAGPPFVIGSGLSDAVLEAAGVQRARALVIATPSDSDNVFITLSAREKSPGLRIHARGESEAGLRRLRLAGADQVISAYQIGALRVAASILRPAVVDFLEISAPGKGELFDLEEVHVGADSRIARSTVGEVEREHPRLRVVALKRGSEAIRLIPEAEFRLAGDDYLVVIGDRAGLERLAAECSS